MEHTHATLLNLAASIVSAHVGHNAVGHEEVPRLIREVYATLAEVERTSPAGAPPGAVARNAGRPTPDLLTCLECGMRMKMLKRHLLTVHGMSPEAYRQKFNLSADEPMVTSNYAALRSELAKASGLGKRPSARGSRRG